MNSSRLVVVTVVGAATLVSAAGCLTQEDLNAPASGDVLNDAGSHADATTTGNPPASLDATAASDAPPPDTSAPPVAPPDSAPNQEAAAPTIDAAAVAAEASSDAGTPAADISRDAVAAAADAEAAAPVLQDIFLAQWPIPPESRVPAEFTIDKDAGTALDNVTGLLWDRQAIQTLVPNPDSPDAAPTQTFATAASLKDAQALCAQSTRGGKTGWRVPSSIEFLSIVTTNFGDQLNSFIFTLSQGTEPWVYWVNRGRANEAAPDWVYDGRATRSSGTPGIRPLHFLSNVGSPLVRCVWSATPAASVASAAPPDRFVVDNANAIVLDKVTNLRWQRDASSPIYSVSQMGAHCSELDTADAGGGYTGWRVPTLKELSSIWNELSTSADPTAFPTISGKSIWSTTGNPSSSGYQGNYVFTFGSGLGVGDVPYGAYNATESVLCVRNQPIFVFQ